MSRAFVREDGPESLALPDLPISPHPNFVTARGLADLRARQALLQAQLAALKARPDRLDRLPEAAAERDLRYLAARLASAILVEPGQAPAGEMAFGRAARLEDAQGQQQTLRITGEDEADPAQGRIAPHAPLARALLGARAGDTVSWARPAGTTALLVLEILPEEAAPSD